MAERNEVVVLTSLSESVRLDEIDTTDPYIFKALVIMAVISLFGKILTLPY